jgi:hypothetical protein
MKLLPRFKPKLLAATLTACAGLAGLIGWLTELNFWILWMILVTGVLFNGLLATFEEKSSTMKDLDE